MDERDYKAMNKQQDGNDFIAVVINWVATAKELPKKHTKVLLYNEDNENYALEFIHEFDLTTDRYTRNWTHWAEFKPPCFQHANKVHTKL
jgi:hypothetical protein